MKEVTLFYLLRLFCVLQEEAELGVVMDNMSAGQELLRQKEDRLKVLENALLGGLVSCHGGILSKCNSKFPELSLKETYNNH